MTNDEFVEGRGFEEVNIKEGKVEEFTTLQKHIIEKCNGFISAEQLHYLSKQVEFELENVYWETINRVLNI